MIRKGNEIKMQDLNIYVDELEKYLDSLYKGKAIDQSLFMKLVEEIGEVAEILNKKAGRKASGNEDLKKELGNELTDVLHYTLAIAALNEIDMNDVIIQKDRDASIKYHRETNLEDFIRIQRSLKS